MKSDENWLDGCLLRHGHHYYRWGTELTKNQSVNLDIHALLPKLLRERGNGKGGKQF